MVFGKKRGWRPKQMGQRNWNLYYYGLLARVILYSFLQMPTFSWSRSFKCFWCYYPSWHFAYILLSWFGPILHFNNKLFSSHTKASTPEYIQLQIDLNCLVWMNKIRFIGHTLMKSVKLCIPLFSGFSRRYNLQNNLAKSSISYKSFYLAWDWTKLGLINRSS